MRHADAPNHCSCCGIDWPKGYHGICRECRAGLPCRADTTDTVAPDPPCLGWKYRDGKIEQQVNDDFDLLLERAIQGDLP